jgi:hypothetical protein
MSVAVGYVGLVKAVLPLLIRHPIATIAHRKLAYDAKVAIDRVYDEMAAVPGGEYYFRAYGVLDPLRTLSAHMVRNGQHASVSTEVLEELIDDAHAVMEVVSETSRETIEAYHLMQADRFRIRRGDIADEYTL